MRPNLAIALAAVLAAAPLAAQAPEPPRTPGLIPIFRAPEGTEVLIDSATVSRSGDSTFVYSTVTRFTLPVGGERKADREVETAEVDCGRERTRGIAWATYLRGRTVSGDTLDSAWKPVDESWLPAQRVICGVLMERFATLPLEREWDGVDVKPEPTNLPQVRAMMHQERFPGGGRWFGSAMVRVRIGADGVPDRSRTYVVWATRPEFSSALLRRVLAMRFTPARKDGQRVPVWYVDGDRYDVRCGNDRNGADEARATIRRTNDRLVCRY